MPPATRSKVIAMRAAAITSVFLLPAITTALISLIYGWPALAGGEAIAIVAAAVYGYMGGVAAKKSAVMTVFAAAIATVTVTAASEQCGLCGTAKGGSISVTAAILYVVVAMLRGLLVVVEELIRGVAEEREIDRSGERGA